ncbi:MAG: V-type ATPase subunit [Anaerolineaceae bacterium]|nr:V-type ATPase subunit [Anaerolineaceae bacterium]
MSEFDYANARIRAMKSRLLDMVEFNILAESGNIDTFIALLSKTDYQKAVEYALTSSQGMACIPNILRKNMQETVGKIQTFFEGRNLSFIHLILSRYDLENIKAILRNLSKPNPSGIIQDTLMPVGSISENVLNKISHSQNLREAIDMMATFRLPIAYPLIALRADQPGVECVEMEKSLERWHYKKTHSILKENKIPEYLGNILKIDADIHNLTTILRFVHNPDEKSRLENGIEDYLVSPGTLDFQQLLSAFQQNNLEDFAKVFSQTIFSEALSNAQKTYKNLESLSEFEKQLHQFRIQYAARLMTKDPLGIGVPLGYLALKDLEIKNLRRCALQIHLGYAPAEIIASIEDYR